MTDPGIYKKAASLMGRMDLTNKAASVFGKPEETDNLYASTPGNVKSFTETNLLARALGGDEAAAALMASRSNAVLLHKENEREKGDWSFQEAMRRVRDMGDEWWQRNLKDLRDLEDIIRQRLAEILGQIAINNERIEFFTLSHQRSQSGMDYFNKHGVLQRDADGTLGNKDMQRLLDAYIMRNKATNPNFRPPETEGGIYEAILRQIEFEQTHEINPRTSENDRLKTEADETQTQLIVLEKFTMRIEEALKIIDETQRKTALRNILQEAEADKATFSAIEKEYPRNPVIRAIIDEMRQDQKDDITVKGPDTSQKIADFAAGFEDTDPVKPVSPPSPVLPGRGNG